MKNAEVRESLRLNAVQVDELATQYGGVRERDLCGHDDSTINIILVIIIIIIIDTRFQTAVNLSVDLNRNFVLRLSSVSELEYWSERPSHQMCRCSCVAAKDKLKFTHGNATVSLIVLTLGNNVQSDKSLSVECGQLSLMIRCPPRIQKNDCQL